MFVIAVVLFVWKWRQNINETKRNRLDQVDEGEGGQLMTSETAPVKDLERQEEKSKQGGEAEGEEEQKKEKQRREEEQKKEKQRREEELKKERTKIKEVHLLLMKEVEQKQTELWKKEKELKEAQRQLETQRTENRQLRTELQEEKTRREGAEREVEDTDPQSDSSEFHLASESQAGGPGEPLHTPHTQTSDSGFDIEVDQHGKYFRLRNTSAQDKQLGLWELYLQVNTKQPIKFTFKQSFILQAGESVRMCARGYGSNYSNTDLKWNHLKPWSSGDRLQFSLYSNTREIQHELCVTIP
ncbi:hypothetical protein PBY51_005754 [Eleginops maclovinus]|uniref:LTD domain-containing protein n=1 Tax=Eleginops maclovinus TaxID=56733 RepID=A0AAN8AAJ7_ELEMC|nr:hypothetical protein PBY51_005754 [Eleginops maclovinus]